MTRFRTPSRSDDHLSNYWNALVHNAPAEELARLARLVEPSEIATIDQAHAGHQRYEPDPVFARRLEQTLMDTATTSSPIVDTIPQPHDTLHAREGSGPVSHRRAMAPPLRARRMPLPVPMAYIALAILLVLASAGGTWWVANLQNDPQPMIAPSGLQDPDDIAGAADYSDHPLVGAWEYPVGVPEPDHGWPCWCISVFTAEGLAMGMDPRPDQRRSLSPHTVAFGIWQPTGERTAVSIVLLPADDGGYTERTITWIVSEDGNTVTSVGTQRQFNPEGLYATLPNLPPIDMVRMTMPDELPDPPPIASPPS
jgi:hypothetical protein